MIANHPIYGVIGYHVTLSEGHGHMIANHPIKGHNYSYHIRGDRSPLTTGLGPPMCRHKVVHETPHDNNHDVIFSGEHIIRPF